MNTELLRPINTEEVDTYHRDGVFTVEGTPHGGYKQSGNGREGGTWGLEEYLEVKTISGWK